MTGKEGKSVSRKEEAISALLNHPSLEAAARTLNISVKTLRRWTKTPGFQKSYLEARRQAVSLANARIQQSSGAAASTLLKMMLHPDVPAAARIRAALCVMQLSHKSIEEEDLEVRIAALEAAIGQK